MKRLVRDGVSISLAEELAPESVAQEAHRIVHGARQDAYGAPRDNFAKIAQGFTAILGTEVTPEQAVMCMIWVKLARELHKPGRDNRVDICGYAAVLDLVQDPAGA